MVAWEGIRESKKSRPAAEPARSCGEMHQAGSILRSIPEEPLIKLAARTEALLGPASGDSGVRR